MRLASRFAISRKFSWRPRRNLKSVDAGGDRAFRWNAAARFAANFPSLIGQASSNELTCRRMGVARLNTEEGERC